MFSSKVKFAQSNSTRSDDEFSWEILSQQSTDSLLSFELVSLTEADYGKLSCVGQEEDATSLDSYWQDSWSEANYYWLYDYTESILGLYVDELQHKTKLAKKYSNETSRYTGLIGRTGFRKCKGQCCKVDSMILDNTNSELHFLRPEYMQTKQESRNNQIGEGMLNNKFHWPKLSLNKRRRWDTILKDLNTTTVGISRDVPHASEHNSQHRIDFYIPCCSSSEYSERPDLTSSFNKGAYCPSRIPIRSSSLPVNLKAINCGTSNSNEKLAKLCLTLEHQQTVSRTGQSRVNISKSFQRYNMFNGGRRQWRRNGGTFSRNYRKRRFHHDTFECRELMEFEQSDLDYMYAICCENCEDLLHMPDMAWTLLEHKQYYLDQRRIRERARIMESDGTMEAMLANWCGHAIVHKKRKLRTKHKHV